MSNPFRTFQKPQLPEYLAPLTLSAMILVVGFRVAPQTMHHWFTWILSLLLFFFSGASA